MDGPPGLVGPPVGVSLGVFVMGVALSFDMFVDLALTLGGVVSLSVLPPDSSLSFLLRIPNTSSRDMRLGFTHF